MASDKLYIKDRDDQSYVTFEANESYGKVYLWVGTTQWNSDDNEMKDGVSVPISPAAAAALLEFIGKVYPSLVNHSGGPTRVSVHKAKPETCYKMASEDEDTDCSCEQCEENKHRCEECSEEVEEGVRLCRSCQDMEDEAQDEEAQEDEEQDEPTSSKPVEQKLDPVMMLYRKEKSPFDK